MKVIKLLYGDEKEETLVFDKEAAEKIYDSVNDNKETVIWVETEIGKKEITIVPFSMQDKRIQEFYQSKEER